MNGFSLDDDDDVLDGDVVVAVVVVLDGVLFVAFEVGLDLIPDALLIFALEEDAIDV